MADILGNASDPSNASPWPLTDDRYLALLLQCPQSLCKLVALHLRAPLFTDLLEHLSVSRRSPLSGHVVQQARDGILQVLFPPPLAGAGPFGQETHVDQASP